MIRLQKDPAEGSREVIERELMRHERRSAAQAGAPAGGNDIARLLGDLGDAKTLEIVALLRPTMGDLEEAALWLAGDGDILGKAGRPLGGTAAAIFDIVTADDDTEPDAPH